MLSLPPMRGINIIRFTGTRIKSSNIYFGNMNAVVFRMVYSMLCENRIPLTITLTRRSQKRPDL
jgi:hypothetical protein